MANVAGGGDWPQFRGPLGNGVAQKDKAPLQWGKGPGPTNNVRWKAKLAGPGNSSPIVSHGRVFVTCAEDSGKKRNLYCFDGRTGKQLGCGPLSSPSLNQRINQIPTAGQLPVAALLKGAYGCPQRKVRRNDRVTAVFLCDSSSTAKHGWLRRW